MRKGVVSLLVVAIAAAGSIVASSQAWAWKPPTHLYGVEAALADAVDGTVSVPRLGGAPTDAPVNATLRLALERHPAAYRAGTIGPDAFPDTFFGQMAIHPDTSTKNDTVPPVGGRTSQTHEWLAYLWEQAWNPATPEPQRLENIAFAAGYLGGHANGDTWAHTWVNNYAGGVFPDFSDLSASDISMRHLVVEGYVDKHRPGFESQVPYAIDAPGGFIADTLILSDFARAHGSSPFYDFFLGMRGTLVAESNALHEDNTTQDLILCPVCVPDPTDSPVNLVELGIDLLLEAYLDAWVDDIDSGLRHWVDVWETIATELFTGKKADADAVFDALKAWALQDFLAMMGLPDFIGEGIYLVGEVISFVTGLIASALDLVFDAIKAVPVVGDLVTYVEGLYDKAADYIRGKVTEVVDHLAGIFITLALGLTDLNPVTRDAIDHDDDGVVTPREIIRVLAEPEEYVREPLFPAGARARLDADMGLPAGTDQDADPEQFRDYDPATFAPLANTTALAKLAMLDEAGLNAFVRARAGGATSALADLYGPHANGSGSWAVPANVMLGWQKSIDAEYQWRTTSPRDSRSYGTGRMWLWEDCVARDRVFRTVFANPVVGVDGLTDTGDPPTGITDAVPPVSELTLTGPVSTVGGTTYVSGSTEVTLSATDAYFAKPELRIHHRTYAAGTPAPAFGPGQAADLAPFTLSGSDGAHRVDHYAVDDSGRCNSEVERSRTLVLDTTPPVITVTSPTPPGPADYVSDAILPLDFTADDGTGAGVDPATRAHFADGLRQPGPPGSVDLFDYPAGTHVYRAEVADMLGNVGYAEVPWRTVVTHTSLQANLLKAFAERGCVRTESTRHALQVKLANAQKADERGNDGASDNGLEAFVNEVLNRTGTSAEPGKTITPTCGAILVTNARWLQSAEES